MIRANTIDQAIPLHNKLINVKKLKEFTYENEIQIIHL
jgi:hypothetical protein